MDGRACTRDETKVDHIEIERTERNRTAGTAQHSTAQSFVYIPFYLHLHFYRPTRRPTLIFFDRKGRKCFHTNGENDQSPINLVLNGGTGLVHLHYG